MKTTKQIGLASLASAALIALAPGVNAAEPAAAESNSGNLVHRVSHALATTQQYSGHVSGYKWGSEAPVNTSRPAWAESEADSDRSGYKWGEAQTVEQSAGKWGRRSHTDQTAGKWGRRNQTEQAAGKWGRRNHTEQVAGKWGRRNHSDQTAGKWGRR